MSIPDVMINQEIENSKAYQTCLVYSTGAATPKKARKWKQVATKPKTTSSVNSEDNIISDDTNVVSANKPTRRRRQTGVTVRDTPTVTKKKTPEQSLKLKGIEMLSDVPMLETHIRKAMKASLRDLRFQHRFNNDEITESEKETTKSGKNDDDIGIDLDETDDEEDEHVDDETQRDKYVHEDEYVLEDDEYVHEEEERVHDYVEEELNDAEIAKTIEGDKELFDPYKVEAEKIEEAKGDGKQVENTLARVDQAKDASTQDNQVAALISVTQKGKHELPSTCTSLSVSSRFVPNVQSSSLLTVPILVIPKPIVLTPIPEIITEAPATTISPLIPVTTSFTSTIQQSTPIPTAITTTKAPSSTTVLPVSETLSAIQRRVSELEKEVKELKQVDHSTTIHALIRSQVPVVVNEYLGSSLGDALQNVL
ncbi:hypothetical protein Tco_1252239 [Tanacetum coccineum]